MNTLGKKVTTGFFIDQEHGFENLQTFWKDKINVAPHESIPAHLHLAYAMLRGKDYRKGFTQVKEEHIHDGKTIDQGLRVAMQNFEGTSIKTLADFFEGHVKQEAFSMLKLRIPKTIGNRITSEAYIEPVTLKIPPEKVKVENKTWLQNLSTQLFGTT